MTTNNHPSMKTWQVGNYVTWAIFGEIIAALEIEDKIDWRRVEDAACKMTDDDTREFIKAHISGAQAVIALSANGGRPE